jgi:hypothetical protein
MCRAYGALNSYEPNPRLAPWATLWSRLNGAQFISSSNSRFLLEFFLARSLVPVLYSSSRTRIRTALRMCVLRQVGESTGDDLLLTWGKGTA